MINKKLFSFVSILLILSLYLTPAFATSNANSFGTSNIVNANDVTLKVNNVEYNIDVKDDAKGLVTEDMIKNIIEKDPKSTHITIYNVRKTNTGITANSNEVAANAVAANQVAAVNSLTAVNSEASPSLIFPDYHTYVSKTYNSYGAYNLTQFVTSVARGATYSFSSSRSFTISANVTGGAKAVDISVNASMTRTYSTTYTFNGPSESSQYTTRMFYIDWYTDNGSYHRYCLDESTTPYPTLVWEQYGDFYAPAYYVEYSRDLIY